MNYAEIKQLILRYSHRTDIDNDFMNQLFELAAVKIGRDCRMIEQERQSTLTFDDEVGLPDGYAMMRSVSKVGPQGNIILTLVTSEGFDTYSSFKENDYTIRNQKIVINGSAEVTLHYFIRPPELSADASTNFVLLAAPHLYLYATLIEIAVFAQDGDAITMYNNLYSIEVERVNLQADAQRYNGSLTLQRVD